MLPRPYRASVALSWTTPANGGSAITGYVLYRATTSDSATPVATLGVTTSYQDTDVSNWTSYYYQVSAVNPVGEGALSNEASATPQAPAASTPPPTPQDLTASEGQGRGVQLNWSAPASNGGAAISGDRIYRGTTAADEETLVNTPTSTSYKDTKVARGATYYYQVSAVDAAGEGSLSNEASATSR